MMPVKNSGFAVWLTGLPSAGKSAIAQELRRLLAEQDVSVQILDSDELRVRLTPLPEYTDEERKWFYETIVFLAELLTGNGVNVLMAATGSRREYRENARSRIVRFAEVHIDCPVEVCRQRDPKGLWQKAERGEIDSLPGAGIPYEAPLSPDLKVDTSVMSINAAGRHIFDGLRRQGFFDPQARKTKRVES
jgi:adenylylsulfate kinase